MEIPKIAIITPVYNGLPYIIECVESVISQDFQEWEMLISDNCSTDGTQEYLETINDVRIKVFKQEKNLGIYGNLNFLFSKAKAPLSQLLCADDYFLNLNCLSKIFNYWEVNSRYVDFARFNYNEPSFCRTIILEKKVMPAIILPQNAALLFFVFGNIPGNLSNMSLKTSLVAKYSNFREDLPYAGDFEFWSRISQKVSMGIQNEILVHVRRHNQVASNYLNRHGELLSQMCEITNTLFKSIIIQYPKIKKILRIQGTLNYDSLQRNIALKIWFNNKNYMSELNKTAKKSAFFYGSFVRWILFVFSLGGRLGRDILAKYIISNYIAR